MVPLLSIFLALLAFATIVAQFIDNVILLDAQKKKLQAQFDTWWKSVEDMDRLKLALMCASKISDLIDRSLGKDLFSRKVIKTGVVTSSCILMLTLVFQGYKSCQPFGVTPWV